jgi:hypothetical protein
MISCRLWYVVSHRTACISNVTQAYSYGRGVRQILTGVSERGEGSVIRYWIQENDSKKHSKPKPQAAAGVWSYLATHVRQRSLWSSRAVTDLFMTEAGFDDHHHSVQSSHPLHCITVGLEFTAHSPDTRLVRLHEASFFIAFETNTIIGSGLGMGPRWRE